jgi:hypothetical protein
MPIIDFDVTSYEPQIKSSFEPLPPGDYQAIISDSAIKATKAGTGEYIELTMQITDGKHSGRRIWERLNISNPNKVAEEIARSQLNGLRAALGIAKLESTEQLHDTPFVLSLDIDRKEPTRNRVMGYSSAKTARHTPRLATAEAPAGKPWERK